MTPGVSIVHFVIKVPTWVQMIFTIHRVQAYQVPIVNPSLPPKIQDGRHETFQHQTAEIFRASWRSPWGCFFGFFFCFVFLFCFFVMYTWLFF